MAGKPGGSARVLLALWAFCAAAAAARADTLDEVPGAALSSAASIPGSRASGLPDDKGTGAASTSISAARWRRRSSTIPTRSNSFRSRARTASPPCNRAKSTCSRATRPGRIRARRGKGCCSPASIISTARAFWCEKSELDFGARTERRLDLRPAGHHDRAQSRRLFPRPWPEGRDGGVLDLRRGDQGL